MKDKASVDKELILQDMVDNSRLHEVTTPTVLSFLNEPSSRGDFYRSNPFWIEEMNRWKYLYDKLACTQYMMYFKYSYLIPLSPSSTHFSTIMISVHLKIFKIIVNWSNLVCNTINLFRTYDERKRSKIKEKRRQKGNETGRGDKKKKKGGTRTELKPKKEYDSWYLINAILIVRLLSWNVRTLEWGLDVLTYQIEYKLPLRNSWFTITNFIATDTFSD